MPGQASTHGQFFIRSAVRSLAQLHVCIIVIWTRIVLLLLLPLLCRLATHVQHVTWVS